MAHYTWYDKIIVDLRIRRELWLTPCLQLETRFGGQDYLDSVWEEVFGALKKRSYDVFDVRRQRV